MTTQTSAGITVNIPNTEPLLQAFLEAGVAPEDIGIRELCTQASLSGGGTEHLVIGQDDPPMTRKYLSGTVLASHRVRRFYVSKDLEVQALCVSNDMENGIADDERMSESPFQEPVGLKCGSCPANEWGSAAHLVGNSNANRGKACSERRNIIFQPVGEEGMSLPILLSLPPTSLANYTNYVSSLFSSKSLAVADVVTEFSVKMVPGGAAGKFAMIHFSYVDKVSDTSRDGIQKFRYQVLKMLNQSSPDVRNALNAIPQEHRSSKALNQG